MWPFSRRVTVTYKKESEKKTEGREARAWVEPLVMVDDVPGVIFLRPMTMREALDLSGVLTGAVDKQLAEKRWA